MTIRDSLAKNFSGGPPFRIRADRILIEVNSDSNLTSIAQQGIDERPNVLDELPVGRQKLSRLQAEVRRLGFNVERLENLGVLVAETDRVANVVSNITDARDTFSNNVADNLESLQTRAEKREPRTLVGAFKPGMNFGQEVDDEIDLEAALRGELISQTLQNPITSAIREMEGVANVELSFTRNTFGPRNLNVDVDALTSFLDIFEENPDAESQELPTVADVRKRIGVPAAWENATGEDVIIAVLDTAFYRGFLEGDRVIDTYSGPDADNAYSDPEEGHGTMCAVSAAGNVDDGAPVNGVAPDADLLLARTTNSAGELVYIEEAWDWLIGHIKDTDKTVISSHSYGVPLCSGRTMDLCNSTTTKLVRAANKREDHQAFYAAGNEALYCFPENTQIRTPYGNANIQDVDVGDMVLSHDGEYHEVEKTFSRDYTGNLINISPYHARDIQLTPNHPVLTREHGGSVDSVAEWADAGEIKAGDYVAIPRVKKYDIVPESLEVPDYNYDSNQWERYQEVIALREERGWGPKKLHDETGVPVGTIQSWIYQGVKPVELEEVPDVVENDEDLNALFGYYVSEGYSDGNLVDFSFHQDEEDRMLDLASKLESVFGLDCKYADLTGSDDKAVHVRVNNTRVAKFFKKYCGATSEDKHFPHWTIHDSNENLESAIREYYRGDGWNNEPSRYSMSTQSSELAHQLQLGLARIGITASITESDGGDVSSIGGRQIVRGNTRHRVIVSKQEQSVKQMSAVLGVDDVKSSTRNTHKPHELHEDYMFVKVKDVSTVEHSDKVYNMRVADTNTYVANNLAVHNCGHRLGGMTNGIMGPNSDPSSIAVGALRFDLRDAQNYSSHGFGTCSGINNNPKPDVSCMLSSLIPYGTEVKDMSTSRGGSAGGTSQATPLTAGVAALVSQITGNAKRSQLENILESTARQPRPTQLNVISGFDARFGHGQVRADDAVDEALSRVQMQ